MVGTSVPTVAHKWMVIPMYDELIKRLRECTAEQNGEKTLWYQAADAIEELTAINERQLLEIAVLSKPRWIPVTERLPEKDQTVLAYCAEDNFCYISRMHQSFEDYDVTHWIPLPHMPKDGES